MELTSVLVDLRQVFQYFSGAVLHPKRCLLAAAAFALALGSSVQADQSLNRVMVVVNDGVITEADLNREISLAEMELRSAGQPLPPRDVLASGLLEELIVDTLLMDAAARASIFANDREVAYALTTIARQNGLTLPQLEGAIIESGVAIEDYETDLRKQLTIRKLIDRQIRRQVDVSDQEINEYLAQNPQEDKPDEVEFDLAHILLKSPSGASESQISELRGRLEEIRQEVISGLAFSEAARRYSDGTKASEGGMLGVRTAEQLPQPFLDAVAEVPPGRLSPVFQSSNGWHLLKVLGRKSQRETVVLQQEVRHILIRASALLPDEQLRPRLERIRERIMAGEDFGAVARLQSEDANTRALGGNICWQSP